MTMHEDSVVQAINDARVLLDTLLASGWCEIHVVSGNTEIFLARNGARANPMRSVPLPAQAALDAALTPGPKTSVTAPHVATLVHALPVGTAVAAGQIIATLRVLDEQEDVEAPVSGTIVRLDAVVGDLIDYGAPLLAIVEAA